MQEETDIAKMFDYGEDLTGFDDELRALAKKMIASASSVRDEVFEELGLFRLFQTIADMKQDWSKADVLSNCEEIGRLHLQSLQEIQSFS